MSNLLDVENAALILSADYVSKDKEIDRIWKGSKFKWILRRPSGQIGAIMRNIVQKWLKSNGFAVERCVGREADRSINDKRVVIKSSTLWTNKRYRFQQIKNQQYDLIICFGLSPHEAHCWIIPKAEIIKQWKMQSGAVTQHLGKQGVDTAWFEVDPKNVPAWLNQYGGSLDNALALIRNYCR